MKGVIHIAKRDVAKRGTIFTNLNSSDLLTEDQYHKPQKVADIRTLSITELKGKNKFAIFEHNRKTGRFKKIQTIPKRKSLTQTIEDIKDNKITIVNQNVTKTETTNATVTYRQSNRLLPKSGIFPQLVALVRVIDTANKRENSYLGFSSKFPGIRPNQFETNRLREECIKMAIAKYFNDFPPIPGEDYSTYIETYIEAERWQYIDAEYNN